jgi:hypothetical protein
MDYLASREAHSHLYVWRHTMSSVHPKAALCTHAYLIHNTNPTNTIQVLVPPVHFQMLPLVSHITARNALKMKYIDEYYDAAHVVAGNNHSKGSCQNNLYLLPAKYVAV